MSKRPAGAIVVSGIIVLAFAVCGAPASRSANAGAAFNVRDFGATGQKDDLAQAAIQKAVDACAAAGGGIVYLPPGEYTTGTIHLRSHVRLFVEAGATVFSIHDKSRFDKDALLYGEDLVGVTIEGRGVFDGEAAYDRRLKGDHEDDFIRPNQVEMEALGLPLFRSFPKPDQTGKMVLLVRCTDVRISGVSFFDSPSWTIHPVACERLVIDGVYIRSSLKDGVWADGIDPDGCKDVRISNCTIETGDDALVFYSMDWFGPARPCENITVTNCRLSSASSAIKFCDGNIGGIRNVTIDNCAITGSNRGIAFMTFDGGVVENVVLPNLTIETVRHEWFWWGDGEPFHFNIKKRSEVHASWPKDKDRPAGAGPPSPGPGKAGAIRNVKIQNVIARGYGSSVCNGHPDSWLDGVSFENVRLTIAHDPDAPYDKAVHGLVFKQARNLRLRDVEVVWEEPGSAKWESGLAFEEVRGLVLDGVTAGQAPGAASAPGADSAPAASAVSLLPPPEEKEHDDHGEAEEQQEKSPFPPRRDKILGGIDVHVIGFRGPAGKENGLILHFSEDPARLDAEIGKRFRPHGVRGLGPPEPPHVLVLFDDDISGTIAHQFFSFGSVRVFDT